MLFLGVIMRFMRGERQSEKVRFRREREVREYKPAEGSWESILVGLRDQYPENVFGMGEGEYWEKLEEKASMGLRAACFQYYLAGTGHITLATMVVNNSPNIKVAVSLGTMSADEKERLVNNLAEFLYHNYPLKYQGRIRQ